ncbi:MAG: helix-turn-helix transcriptional regulator [Gammaproteobacteria bacterium]
MFANSPASDPVKVSRLISLAYEAPFLPSGWRDFTQAAATFMQTRLAMIHHMDYVEQARSFHIAGGIDESFSQAFTPRWSAGGDDLYLQVMRDQPAGVIRLSSDIVAPDAAHQTEIHQQLAGPWQLEHFLFASLGNHNGVTWVLSLGRSVDDEPFSAADIDLLNNVLLPHLCRSISAHTSITGIRQNNALLASIIDMTRYGIVVFDASGRSLLVNETAAAIFSQDKGLAMQNGQLRTADSQAQARLDAALLNAIALSQSQPVTPPVPLLIPRNGETQPWRLVFSPLSQHTGSADFPQQAACLALIYEPRRNSHSELSAALIKRYALSKAEARLCKTLVSGKSTQEAADALNISTNTVKTHLAGIFHKTGVHSQTALLHLLTTRSEPWN